MTLDDLRSQLESGLHEANVRALLKIANKLVKEAESPLPFYVLASVFGDLDSLWADQPVESSQIEAAEKDIAPALRQVMFSVQRAAPPEEVLSSMDRLVARFIELRERGELG
jgi:hypothetical protein